MDIPYSQLLHKHTNVNCVYLFTADGASILQNLSISFYVKINMCVLIYSRWFFLCYQKIFTPDGLFGVTKRYLKHAGRTLPFRSMSE
jgi:hypothetical protein